MKLSEIPPISNVSGRPQIPRIERLRNRIWIRMLRIHPAVRQLCEAGTQVPERGAWARLVPHLFPDLAAGEMAQGHLQGLMGVVHDGVNPERLMRRFERSELDPAALTAVQSLPGVQEVQRRRSGPAAGRANNKSVVYLEAPLDLVARSEAIAPGSKEWLQAPLWGLAGPVLPRLEELRLGVLLLKRALGLCNPSPEELAPLLDSVERERLVSLSIEDQKATYRDSLMPLAANVSSDAISLLAGLVADSFMTDQEDLHEIHCEVFAAAMRWLLVQPLMGPIAREFEILIGARVLNGTWDLPMSFHVPSLAAPFMSIKALLSLRARAFPDLSGASWLGKKQL